MKVNTEFVNPPIYRKELLAAIEQVVRERDAARVELLSAKDQLAAQLSELNSISDALGTNEGHSSVDHILALRGQLAAAKADLHNAKKSLARYQEVLDQNLELKEQLDAANKRAEDAERDAKRYRWLRVCAEDEARLDALDGAPRTPTEFDEAIDEAMGVKNG